MDPQRSYDPFGPGMSAGVFSPAPMPKKTGKKRRKKHPVRRFFRTGLLILLACLLLLTGGLGGAALYDALAGRTRTLAGETVIFPQLQADRENALSLPEVYETARPWVVTITCRFEDAVSYGTGFSLKEGGLSRHLRPCGGPRQGQHHRHRLAGEELCRRGPGPGPGK